MNKFITQLTNKKLTLSKFIEESYKLGIISYDYNLISFDNNHVFNINKEALIGETFLQTCYSNIIDLIIKEYKLSFTISFVDTLSVQYNSISSYIKNTDVFFIKENAIKKKSVYGINNLLTKYENSKELSILIPFIFKREKEAYVKILEVIKLINKIKRINKIVIFNIFNLNDNPESTLSIENILDDFKQNNLDIVVIEEKGLNNLEVFDILKNENLLDQDTFNKISMFLSQDEKFTLSNPNSKIIQNKLFLDFKNITIQKKSRVCLGLEEISDLTQLIKYTNLLGSYIVAIKINTNYIFNESVLNGLKKLSQHHNFVIIDDKKIRIQSMADLKKLNLFSWVDVVSLKLEFISDEIDSWFKNIREKVNPNASFMIDLDEFDKSSLEISKKLYSYYNNIVFGVIGLESTCPDMFTAIDYKHVSKLNDNFKALQSSDLVILGEELYNSKNPIEIITKINSIVNQHA